MHTPKQSFIALDLEMNQPSRKIIQIGIAIGVPDESPDSWVVNEWLVDPGEPISPAITALTGISDQDIRRKAKPISEIVYELSLLLDAYKPFTNPVTWGGGDSDLLLDLIRSEGLAFPYFGRRWIDVKTWHTFIALAKGKSGAGGLRSVMGQYQVGFQGAPHRADIDALNTLRLFFKLLNRQRGIETIASLAKTL